MALNWVMLESRRPVPLPHEQLVLSNLDDAELLINIPPNSLGMSRKLQQYGVVHLTDQRFIFVASEVTTPSDLDFDNLSIPLISILSSSFHQPFFSANYLSLRIKAVQGGGLSDDTVIELRFRDRGLFGFVSALEKVRERAIAQARQKQQDNVLPTYSPSGRADNAPPRARNIDDLPPAYDVS